MENTLDKQNLTHEALLMFSKVSFYPTFRTLNL
jgi:hypothetical protein